MDDAYYVASWGYIRNVGSQVQQFMYVNSLISRETYVLCKDCK